MAFTDNSTGGRVIKEGLMPVKITLDDTCDVGDLIGYDQITDTAWEKAAASGKIPAQLVAGEPCKTSGDEIVCYRMAYVSGFTLATAGDMVYLSDTAGDYASTPGGWIHQCVGQCISATEAFICPSSTPLMGYAPTGTGMGAFIRAELASGQTAPTATGGFSGMRVDVKTVATATVAAADIYGLYLFMQLQATGQTGAASMIRLEDGCSTNCGLDSWMLFVGGSGQDPPDYLFEFSTDSPTNGAWERDSTGNANTIAGHIKLKMAGDDRYIYLYALDPAS